MPKTKKPFRKDSFVIQFYTDSETGDALDEYIASRKPDQRATKRAILETALRAYLRGKGFWPKAALRKAGAK